MNLPCIETATASRLMDLGQNPRNSWTQDQVNRLVEIYPKLGKQKTAQLLGKTPHSIRTKASRLGLKLMKGTEFWNEFQERAAASKVGQKLSREHVERAVRNRKWSMLGKPKQSVSVETRSKLSTIAKSNWRDNRETMLAGCQKAWANNTERRMKLSKWAKQWWAQNGDKYLTGEVRQSKSDTMARMRASRSSENCYSRCRRGFREDLGQYFRSSWEANYARYLNFLKLHGEIQSWKYEPTTFWFEAIKRGVRSYKPDFLVILKNGKEEYHEVKGWDYAKGRTARKRMSLYHPNISLQLIDQTRYRSIERSVSPLIRHWEGRKRA